MAEPDIDPRYAAQFQRGFDPARHAPVERRGPLRIEVPRAVAQRVPDPPPIVDRRAPVVEEPTPGRTIDPSLDDADDLPAPRPRTEWAVLATGVGLLIAAALLFGRSVADSTRYSGVGPEFFDQFLSMAAGTLTGPLLVAGMVAILLWVLLRAVSPNRGRR